MERVSDDVIQRLLVAAVIVAGLLLPLVAGLLTPAFAVVGPSSGPPQNECFGLLYLDKFDWNDDGTGSFDQGDTSADQDPTADGYTYASTTGVTISYTVDQDDEVHAASWTSTTPVDRVWEKAGNDTDAPVAYDEATAGSESVVGNAYSHLTWCYDEDPPQEPTVEVNGECDEVAVTITNPDQVEFSVDVLLDGQFLETITASKNYVLTEGQELSATDGASTTYGTFTWQDCTEPTVTLSGECDTATVTITNPAQFKFFVEVFINDVSQGEISETTEYSLNEGETLTTSQTEGESVSWEDCSEPPPPVPTVASFSVTTECVDTAAAINYVVEVTEGDDPFGTVTITVADAEGAALVEEDVTGPADDTWLLPGRDGEAVTVTWTFDDASEGLTLAENCAEVLGVVEEKEPDPAPQPDPVVKDTVVEQEELPAAGVTSDGLLAAGGGFLALGCAMLLATRRRDEALA